jgi:biuret amidohydrolase
MAHVAATDPYAWPYDGDLRGDALGLVVCGAQRQLAPLADDSRLVLAALHELAELVRAADGTVLWVRHGRRSSSGRSALPVHSRIGWELLSEPAAGDVVVDAAGWDGCYSSELEHVLRQRGVAHVALGGLASELTVDSTVRTLNDRGFECLVLTDGCAPTHPEMGRRAHHSLTMSGGIFGALGTTDDLAAAIAPALVPTTPRSAP